eukprot:SAG11_NODE_430_length_9532_cov_13.089685_7_plen_101_part_00
MSCQSLPQTTLEAGCQPQSGTVEVAVGDVAVTATAGTAAVATVGVVETVAEEKVAALEALPPQMSLPKEVTKLIDVAATTFTAPRAMPAALIAPDEDDYL